MSEALAHLLELLQLERLDTHLFRGQSQDLGLHAVFGGQVMGQALSAAAQTVDDGLYAHSYHCYFLRAGDAKLPIIYQVTPLLDGRSFANRHVVAQQQGQPVCVITVSFQRREEGFEHQAKMPDVVGPDGLLSDLELTRRFAQYLPEKCRDKLTAERPVDLRVVDPINPLTPQAREAKSYVWFRANGELPEASCVHSALLAYVADFHFLVAALFPHARSYWSPGMQVATLDHTMWFHRPVRMDEWLLYVVDSPSASGGRGFVRGQVFDQQGVLIASCAQEGVMRERPVGSL